jgi:hypothetical protein
LFAFVKYSLFITKNKQAKKEIDSDPRYKSLKASSDREELFLDYVKDPQGLISSLQESPPVKTPIESATSQIKSSETDEKLDKKARQLESLLSRQAQVQRERLLQDKANENQKARLQHSESETIFKTLLVDHVKSHSEPWIGIRRLLEKDPRFRLLEGVSDSEMALWFSNYTRQLSDKLLKSYYDLLSPLLTPTSTWEDVFPQISSHPLLVKWNKSPVELEALFTGFKKQNRELQRSELRQALRECGHVEFHIRQAVSAAAAASSKVSADEDSKKTEWDHINMSELYQVLIDKRFTEYPNVKEREDILTEYIQGLIDKVNAEKGGALDRTIAKHAGGKV